LFFLFFKKSNSKSDKFKGNVSTLESEDLKETLNQLISSDLKETLNTLQSNSFKESIRSLTLKKEAVDSEEKITPIDYNYDERQIARFKEVQDSKGLIYFKNTIFILLLVTLLYELNNLIQKNSNFNSDKFKLSFNYSELDLALLTVPIIIAFFITHIISYLVHAFVFFNIYKIYKADTMNFFNSFIKYEISIPWYYFFVSPDYFYAKFFKEKIKQAIKLKHPSTSNEYWTDKYNTTPHQWNFIKIEFENFIKKSNWLNLCISIIFVIVFLVLCYYYEIDSIKHIQWALIIIILRLFSRGIEMALAFYKDVVRTDSKLFMYLQINNKIIVKDTKYQNGFKSSLLREGARLSLAVHSLAELFVTFALAYWLLFSLLSQLDPSYFFINNGDEKFPANLELISPTFLETLLFSSSLGLFNISYITYENILISILHFSQVILSAILILLSVARYLNEDKKLTPEDDILYKLAALRGIKQKNTCKKEIDISSYEEKTIILKKK